MTEVRKMSSHKRKTPDLEDLASRSALLSGYRDLAVSPSDVLLPPLLAPGNSKTGYSGSAFSSIHVWNIPPAATCPGASNQCLSYCYNGQSRKDVYNIDQWRTNLAWFIHKREELKTYINETIRTKEKPAAVRIHSAGDFFSESYISFWQSIISHNPDCTFWAYTRSWAQVSLLPHLEEIKTLNNLELFASWDHSMPPPPKWRLSIVTDGTSERKAKSVAKQQKLLFCPEQNNKAANCASCGYCMRKESGGVLFVQH